MQVLRERISEGWIDPQQDTISCMLLWLHNYLVLHVSVVSYFQLDNADEQAAQVRRELDSRLHAAEELTKVWVLSLCCFSFGYRVTEVCVVKACFETWPFQRITNFY